LKWDYHGVLSQHWSAFLGSLVKRGSFYTKNNRINGPNLGGIFADLPRPDDFLP
jgi:hypothetical protein